MIRPLVLATALFAAAGPALAVTDEQECLVEPTLTVKLATPVAGVVSEVLVDRGAVVRKGAVIAKLESSVEENAVALAKARAGNDYIVKVKQARVEFLARKKSRTEQLRTNNVSTEVALDEVDTELKLARFEAQEAALNVELAKLELQRAVEQLNQRTIRSPVDGVVVERSLWAGEFAYEQAQIATLAQIDPLNVEVFAPIALAGKIATGMRATVLPEPPIGGRHQATVTVVDHVFDARSGTFGVRLQLPNPKFAIPAGIRCKLRFDATQ